MLRQFTRENIPKEVSGIKIERSSSIRATSRRSRSYNHKLADSALGVAPNEFPQPILYALCVQRYFRRSVKDLNQNVLWYPVLSLSCHSDGQRRRVDPLLRPGRSQGERQGRAVQLAPGPRRAGPRRQLQLRRISARLRWLNRVSHRLDPHETRRWCRRWRGRAVIGATFTSHDWTSSSLWWRCVRPVLCVLCLRFGAELFSCGICV